MAILHHGTASAPVTSHAHLYIAGLSIFLLLLEFRCREFNLNSGSGPQRPGGLVGLYGRRGRHPSHSGCKNLMIRKASAVAFPIQLGQ